MEFVLEILSTIGWVLLAITILVFVHEMGHFLTAKMFNMRVDKFSVGFPPKIIGKTIGETEYVLGATPLGGYVKIAGMVDESMDTDNLQQEPEPWEFRAKPVWQRIIVITAGVIFNVILAAIIFISLKYAYGDNYIPAENIEQVFIEEGSIAHNIGLRTGDRIVTVGGRTPERFRHVEEYMLLSDPLTITVEREGEQLTFNGPDDIMTQLGKAGDDRFGVGILPSIISDVTPDLPAEAAGLQSYDNITSINGDPVAFWKQIINVVGAADGSAMDVTWERDLERADTTLMLSENTRLIGVRGDKVLYEASITPAHDETGDKYMLGVAVPQGDILTATLGVRMEQVPLSKAVSLGMTETWTNSIAIVTSLKKIFSGREDFRENLGGPVKVAQVTKQAADAGAFSFWRIVALLSITLAIMNILPIPALDGGHLVFLIYEGVTRREPSLKVRMWLQQIGMVLLLVFMTFLVFNDILRL